MKATFTRKLAVMCLSAVMTLGIGVGVAGLMPANAANIQEYDVTAINSEYLVNTQIAVSDTTVEGKTVFPKTITVGGDSATAYSIKYPDGTVHGIGEEIALKSIGKYTITYQSQSNHYFDTFSVLNKFADILSDGYFEKKINVESIAQSYYNDSTIVVSDTGSGNVIPETITVNEVSYTYTKTLFPDKTVQTSKSFAINKIGRYVVYYENSATGDYYTDAFTSINTTRNNSSTEYASVRAVMTPGTSLDINKIINLNDPSITDEDGTVDLFNFKYTVGESTIESYLDMLYITIQDVNDPNVYIKLNLENYDASNSRSDFYFRASTKDLPDVGCEDKDGSGETSSGKRKALSSYIDGTRYLGYHSWAGKQSSGPHANNVISYNPKTNVIYKNGEMIVDLDEPGFYDAGAKFFTGFPSNNVKISVSASGQTSTYYLEFAKIGNSSGVELHEMLTHGVPDTAGPEIFVDYEETQVGSVYAKLGSKFKLPSATAIDANSPSNVAIRVYKNYSSSSKEFVPLESDGSVTLSQMIVYTAEYTSYDVYGNLSKVTFNIVPVEKDDLTASDEFILDDGNITLKASKISLVSGEQVSGKIFEIFDTFNNKSKLKLNVSIYLAGQTVYSVDLDSTNLEDDVHFDYIPQAVGDYTIVYTYSDNVTKGSKAYTVTCTSNNSVNFLGDAFLYKYYIYGLEYDLSSFTAYKFGSTLEPQQTTVEVSYDGGEYQSVGDSVVIGADSEGNVPVEKTISTVKFRYNSGSAVYETDTAVVVDVRRDTTRALELKGTRGNLDYSKYFDLSNFEAEEVGTTYRFDAKTSNGSAELKIISPLTFDNSGNFMMQLSTYSTHKDFSKLTVKLTDAYDPSNQLKFNFETIQKDTVIYTDGGRKYPTVEFPLFSNNPAQTSAKLSFSFNLNNQIISASNKSFSASFRPTNNLFYVSLELGGIVGENAAISVTTIANVEIDNSLIIDNKPPITYYQSSAGNYAIGSEVTIFAPIVADFATPFSTKKSASVKVTLNNVPVTSVEGVVLDGTQDPTKNYTLKVTDFITYRIDYKATDVAGKNAGSTYRITGVDKVGPVITLNYGFNENTVHNVTLGKPFTIDYSVTDDRSVGVKVQGRVIIFNDTNMRPTYSALPMECSSGEGEYTLITDTCTLTTRGMHTVYVYAFDEVGNATYAKYKVNVK